MVADVKKGVRGKPKRKTSVERGWSGEEMYDEGK